MAAPAPAAQDHEGRWERRPAAAKALRALAFVVPVLAAGAAAAAMVRWGRRPDRAAPAAAWFLAVVALTVATMVLAWRLARRLLPLSALLRVSLPFPGPAPRRVRLGLGVGRSGDLDDRLVAFRQHGLSADPLRAATQAVALLAALAARHWVIWSHAERVARLSDRLAADLGLSPADRDRLRWGALLHDLGSLAVDPTLPVRARPLEGADIRAVHAHPAAGSRLVAPLRAWLGDWAAAVDQHHERWDGGGYPHGLAGEEIAPAARIVAVADAFETMTSPRSYRPSATAARARAELTREAGRQFDPVVAETFVRRRVGRDAAVTVPYRWRADTPVWGRLRRPAVLAACSAALVAAALAAGLPVERTGAPAADVAGRTVERPGGAGTPAPTTGAAGSVPTTGGAATGASAADPVVAAIPRQVTLEYASAVMRALDGALGDALRELVAGGGPTPGFDAHLAAIYEEPELSRKRGVYASEGERNIAVLRKDPPDPVTAIDQVVRGEPSCMVLAVRRDFSQLLTQAAEPPPPSFVVLRPREGADRSPRNPTAWSIAFDGATVDGRPPSAVC